MNADFWGWRRLLMTAPQSSIAAIWVHCALRRHNFIVRLASYSDARTRTRRGLVTAQCHRHEHGSRLIEKPRLKAICSFLAGGRQKDAKVVRWRLN
jgi:hypothetical protein